MPAKTYKPEEIVSLVRNGTSSFFFQGDDELAMSSARAALSELIPEATRVFNEELASGGDIDAGRFRESLVSLPMMSPHRLFTIRQPERLSSASNKVIMEYLQSPHPETILVLVASKKEKSGGGGGGGTALARLKKKMTVVSFNGPPPWELHKWVDKYLKKYEIRIERRAAGELIDSVGNDLRDLANELDKLALVRDKGETIDSADVNRIVGQGRTAEIQQLRKSLLAGDRATAFRVVGGLLYQGEPPVKLINFLSRTFMDLWRVKAVKRRAGDEKSAASMLGLWPSLVRDCWQAAERIDPEGLAQAQEILYRTDFRLKTGRGNPRILLQQAVLRLSGLIEARNKASFERADNRSY
ncbi:DNA polymerase III subunit delta [candidate division KSB1 bacterium]